jgi:hypothetical protein
MVEHSSVKRLLRLAQASFISKGAVYYTADFELFGLKVMNFNHAAQDVVSLLLQSKGKNLKCTAQLRPITGSLVRWKVT